jgi:serine/threonine protein kinase
MNPERWQQVDKLLERVLEQDPSRRQLFLEDACKGDAALREEVKSLLAAHEQAGSALSSPALQRVAHNEGTDHVKSLVGQTLSHYQIVSRLGQGGMGVVYKALDTQLDRFVAIKVLPPELIGDVDRKRRFAQEAKAASALNHPNIVTIYEIASDQGTDFIVMEYVAGKTLDQMIPRKGMRLNDALKIAIPIADALAAAHGAGIVHRDLKPANVMVGENGQVKVLDFGLAKLVQRKRSDQAETETQGQSSGALETKTGMIVGTASYMSPEQAEGKPVDHRCDIFSFGAVLYEMVTSRRAFQGGSHLATLTAIVREEPKPASHVVHGIPKDLDRILDRCLRKDPERRFQSAADLKVVLQELSQEFDSTALAAEFAGASGKKGSSSAVRWAAVALAAIGLVGVTWLWLGRSDRTQPETALTPVPLTSYPGWEDSPSFSPDGNQVAFAWAKAGRDQEFDIYLKQIGVEEPVPFSDHPAPEVNPVWSPDGRAIAFARIVSPGRIDYIVKPQRGGSERTIAEFDVSSANLSFFTAAKWCTWAPDSKSLVVVGKNAAQASDALFLISLETLGNRKITDPPPGLVDSSPAVSPDGRTLAFSRGDLGSREDLHLLTLTEEMRPQGEPKKIPSKNPWNLFPAWTSDGSEVLFVSCHTRSDMTLWRMGVSQSARPSRLAFDAPWTPAVSPKGNRLAYSTWNSDSNVWRIEVDGKAGEPKKLISSTFFEGTPAYSPDGRKIAFMSSRSGSWEIWVSNSDGSYPEQLTRFEGPKTDRPSWSPDGKRIAFYSDVKGNRDVYVIRSDGGALRQLTTDPARDGDPGWSADGKWIYFGSSRGQNQMETIWKVPVDGGEPVSVSGIQGNAPVESPDGRFLYYSKGWPDTYSIWRVPAGGSRETLALDSLHPEGAWVAVNEGIYFISRPDEKDICYIRFKEMDGGRVRTIAPIKGRPYWGLTVSPDRRNFLYVQSDTNGSDLMLVENFQ